MIKVNFYNEKGNVAPKVREAIRKQILGKVKGVVADNLGDFEVIDNANGGFSIPVAEDVKGNVIYAHFSIVVNDKDADYKPAKSKGKAKAEPKDEPKFDIFAD